MRIFWHKQREHPVYHNRSPMKQDQSGRKTRPIHRLMVHPRLPSGQKKENEIANLNDKLNCVTWQASLPSSPPAQKLEAGKINSFSVTAFIFAVQSWSSTTGTWAALTFNAIGPAVDKRKCFDDSEHLFEWKQTYFQMYTRNQLRYIFSLLFSLILDLADKLGTPIHWARPQFPFLKERYRCPKFGHCDYDGCTLCLLLMFERGDLGSCWSSHSLQLEWRFLPRSSPSFNSIQSENRTDYKN